MSIRSLPTVPHRAQLSSRRNIKKKAKAKYGYLNDNHEPIQEVTDIRTTLSVEWKVLADRSDFRAVPSAQIDPLGWG